MEMAVTVMRLLIDAVCGHVHVFYCVGHLRIDCKSLTATLYPEEKTHYLNILHAGWPGGLILGGLIAYFFASADAQLVQVRWEILVATF